MKLLEFSIQNFRSIRERETFTLLAEASKSKPDNVFQASIKKREGETSLRLLKTAVIYGANASGKSNFVKAVGALRWLVTQTSHLKVGDAIATFEPFKLDSATANQPVTFSITFLIEQVKYEYNISFNKYTILEETLYFYPLGRRANLYKRIATSGQDYALVIVGALLKDKDVPKVIFNNQTYLSKFGSDTPNEQLTEVFKNFYALEVWNALDNYDIEELCKEISNTIADKKNEQLRVRLSQLIKVADTGIEEVRAERIGEDEFSFHDSITDDVRTTFIEQNNLRTLAIHNRYENRVLKGQVEFDLLQYESQGTKVLFALGGIIIEILDKGGILFFDELDNSLHADLCKFLIRLFNNPISNPKGAQLVFSTHEVTLLDKVIFRKDQIWFTKKDKYGETILYSTKDLEDVREDTNFEAQYRAGKYQGKPKIKALRFIYPTTPNSYSKNV